jgi:tetratricopeptide (TPR) repeat protein
MSVPIHRSTALRLLIGITLSLRLAVGIAAAQAIPTQSAPKDDPERQQALALYHAGKFVEAMPRLEQLAAANPSDVVVKEGLAFSVMAYAASLTDPDLRKKARARARAIAVQAKQMGDNSSLLQVVLDLPEDGGSEAAYSNRKDVDDVMKAAEADFVHGDFDKARDGYLHALILDPKNYEAALFIGDVYFKQHINGSAGEWFARASEIDPNRETAYRYWGDALWDLGKSSDAREKYINAIIAEPYSPRSWVGLGNWLQRNKLQMNNLRLKDRASVTVQDATHVNVNLDPSLGKDDPNNVGWAAYGMMRATWRAAFSKRFPNESKYRRTMTEETESLTVMINVLKEQKDYQAKLKDLDPSLQSLIKLQEAGLLDPFVLINRADKEIALDYAPYRAAHRDVLYRYFDEFVVPKAPPTPSQ